MYTEEQLAFIARKQRRRRILFNRWLPAAAGLVGVALSLTALPSRMLRNADDDACWRAIEETASGSPAACEARAQRWLAWPGILPWRRDEARTLAWGIREVRAEHELREAARITLDPRARDAAVDGLVSALEAGAVDRVRAKSHVVYLAHEYGAFERLARLSRFANDPFERGEVFSAARLVVDDEALIEAARLSKGDGYTATENGAALCLLGRQEEGLGILRLAQGGAPAARLAIAACGGEEIGDLSPDAVTLRGINGADISAWVTGFDGRYLEDRLRVPLVALVLARKDLDLIQTLALVFPDSGRGLAPERVDAPWSMLGNPAPMPLAALEAAVRKLEGLAATAPDSISAKEVQEREASLAYNLPSPSALQAPAKYLLRAAWVMDVDAAIERVRRGDLVGARRWIEEADARGVAGFEESSAWLHLAVGDAAGALRLAEAHLDRAGGALPGSVEGPMHAQRAYALAALGRFGDAYEASKRADDATLARGSWLTCALAVRAGRRDPLATADRNADTRRHRPGDEDGPWLSFWGLAAQDEAARCVARGKLPGHGFSMAEPGWLACIAASSGAGDAETWLDSEVGSDMATDAMNGRLARAEAARWRGDAAAAAKWEGRITRVRRWIIDDRTALLARIAKM